MSGWLGVPVALAVLVAVVAGIIMGVMAIQQSERESEIHGAAQACLSQGEQLSEIRFGESEEAEQFKCRTSKPR